MCAFRWWFSANSQLRHKLDELPAGLARRVKSRVVLGVGGLLMLFWAIITFVGHFQTVRLQSNGGGVIIPSLATPVNINFGVQLIHIPDSSIRIQ
ncbi:hypothetical protein C8R44DRAFT_783337 [Mycena epipterygia]|nr:hypothetical protein C8R44DRAFT_783337 [Mycena epipterygia]